jgi:hypothetical protein
MVKISRVAALLSVLLFMARGADAAWETVPEVSLFADADDNLLMDPVEQEDASRMGVDAGLAVSNFTERGNFYVEPRVVADRYSDPAQEQYETQDLYFGIGGERNWRVASLGFRSRYSEELILHSEFIDVVPDDPDLPPGENPVDPDTGRVETFADQRELLDLRGNLDFSVSDRNVFRFEGSHQDAHYSGAGALIANYYSDYENTAAAVSILRRVDARNRVTARIGGSQFYSERNDNNSDSFAVEGTFTRSIAQTWTMNLTAGVQRTEYDFLQGGTRIDNAATSPRFALGFRKRAERTQWNVDFSHRVQPNGNGFLVRRRDWRTFATYQFKPRLIGRFGVRFAETKTLDEVRSQDDRENTTVELGVEWAIKPIVFLEAGYSLYTQEFVNEGTGQADSNVFAIGITYRGRSRQDQNR